MEKNPSHNGLKKTLFNTHNRKLTHNDSQVWMLRGKPWRLMLSFFTKNAIEP
jgi:hypothetical protein